MAKVKTRGLSDAELNARRYLNFRDTDVHEEIDQVLRKATKNGWKTTWGIAQYAKKVLKLNK